MNLHELLQFGLLQAQAAAPQQNVLFTFGPLILIFAIMYFLMIRPQQKRQKEHKKMIDALAVGDEIITTGGMLGRVTKVTDSYLHITVNPAASQHFEVVIQRSAVLSVLPAKTLESL